MSHTTTMDPSPHLLILVLFTLIALTLTPVLTFQPVSGSTLSEVFQHCQITTDTAVCYVNCSNLNITGLTTTDIGDRVTDGCILNGNPGNQITWDFSGNFISSLPDGFTYVHLVPTLTTTGGSFNFSNNLFTGSSIYNFFHAGTLSYIFAADRTGWIDLSGNNLGPSLPSIPAQLGVGLYLRNCGITNIPSNTFQGYTIAHAAKGVLDLSWNNLRTGLNPGSFDQIQLSSGPMDLILQNCNLRTSSLVAAAGLLLCTTGVPSYGINLYLNNIPINSSYTATTLTSDAYLSLNKNVFAELPDGLLSNNKAGTVYKLRSIYFGEFLSYIGFNGLFNDLKWDLTDPQPPLTLQIDMAPTIALTAVGGVTNYCPVQQLAWALTGDQSSLITNSAGSTTIGFMTLTVTAYLLNTPASIPNLMTCDLSQSICLFLDCQYRFLAQVNLPTEPAFMIRSFYTFINSITATPYSPFPKLTLHVTPPVSNVWNTHLNRSDWMPYDLLCDIKYPVVIVPGLPNGEGGSPNFPFSLPDNSFACWTTGNQQLIYTQVGTFSSGIFSGRSSTAQIEVVLPQRRLYQGWLPIPIDMFTPLANAVTLQLESYTGVQNYPPDGFDCPYSSCPYADTNLLNGSPYIYQGQYQSCPSGAYASTVNTKDSQVLNYCAACPIGYYCNPSINSQPLPCDKGTYQPNKQQISCLFCSKGAYNPFTAQASPAACVLCPPGTQNPIQGGGDLSSCVQCPLGTASASSGVASCPLCPAGTYQDAVGQLSCTNCPANTYLEAKGGQNISACLPCPQATPLSPAGSTSLYACSAGAPCADGYYTRNGDSSSCQSICPLGSACSSGKKTTCAPGSYADTPGLATCKLCPQGYYSIISNSSNISDCQPCVQGTYNPLQGSSSPASCLSCGPGTYNGATASTSIFACQPCPTGTASLSSGVAECLSCAPGTYQNMTGKFQCEKCPANYYLDHAGATTNECQKCPDATPLSPAGSTSVLSCSTGITCPNGYYTQVTDTLPCSSACPLGSYCTGGVAKQCDAGSYTNVTGAGLCHSCGAGYYSTNVGSSSVGNCLVCPVSTYSMDDVSSACTPCPSGTIGTTVGSTSPSSCITQTGCLSPSSSNGGTNLSSTSSLCQVGASTPISLAPLLSAGLPFLSAYSELIQDQFNVLNLSYQDSGPLTAPEITRIYRRYAPARNANSLRLVNFQTDATLSQHGAALTDAADTTTTTAATTASSNSTSSTLSTYAVTIVLAIILSLALLMLPIYRTLPPKFVYYFDRFSTAHDAEMGNPYVNQPTQFGAAMTWSFIWIAVLVVIFLATASNTVTTSSLVPPSSISSYASTATGDFEITIRAYSSATSVNSYCVNNGKSIIGVQDGFSSAFTTRTEASNQICALAADCIGCSLSGGSSSVTFTFPYDTQFFEWELFVTGAAPKTWSRRYGILQQLPNHLIDAKAELQFTAIESYFTDKTTSGDGLVKSGFELDFLQYASIQPQSQDTYSPASTVQLTFLLTKSDIMFDSSSANKLSTFQLIVSILTAIVSLFSIFVVVFNVLESQLLRRVLRVSSGELHYDMDGHIIVKSSENKVNHHNKSKQVEMIQSSKQQDSNSRSIVISPSQLIVDDSQQVLSPLPPPPTDRHSDQLSSSPTPVNIHP